MRGVWRWKWYHLIWSPWESFRQKQITQLAQELPDPSRYVVSVVSRRWNQIWITANWFGMIWIIQGFSKLFQTFSIFHWWQGLQAGLTPRKALKEPNGAVAPRNCACSNNDSNMFKQFLCGTCMRIWQQQTLSSWLEVDVKVGGWPRLQLFGHHLRSKNAKKTSHHPASSMD